MENEIVFDFNNVPARFQLCFLEDCPKKNECLRQLATRNLPEKLDFGPAVYPNMKRDENGCRLFTIGQPMKMAWGFNKLFAEVKKKDDTALRDAIKEHLGGHTAYYRYHHGERLLDSKQQEWIIKLFQKKGYTEGLEFDHYTTVYSFR